MAVMETKTEKYFEHEIRFFKKDGEWWVLLKDICDVVELNTFNVSQRVGSDNKTKIPVERSYGDSGSTSIQHMLAVNSIGIYEALYNSKKIGAREFLHWLAIKFQLLKMKSGMRIVIHRERLKDLLDVRDRLVNRLKIGLGGHLKISHTGYMIDIFDINIQFCHGNKDVLRGLKVDIFNTDSVEALDYLDVFFNDDTKMLDSIDDIYAEIVQYCMDIFNGMYKEE